VVRGKLLGIVGEEAIRRLVLRKGRSSCIPIPAGIPVLATVPNVMYSSNSNASPKISPRAPLAMSNDSGDGTSSTSSSTPLLLHPSSSASLSLEAVSKVFPLSLLSKAAISLSATTASPRIAMSELCPRD